MGAHQNIFFTRKVQFWNQIVNVAPVSKNTRIVFVIKNVLYLDRAQVDCILVIEFFLYLFIYDFYINNKHTFYLGNIRVMRMFL